MARLMRYRRTDETNDEIKSFASVSSAESLESVSTSTTPSSPPDLSDSESSNNSTLNPTLESLLTATKKSSRFSSSTSLSSALGITIPSHKQFGTFIHKHEVPRKILHVSIGFLTLWLYTIGIQLNQVTPVLATLLLLIGSIDFIRLRSNSFNQLYVKYVGFLMREKEVNAVNGVIWYLVGLVLVFMIFPKDICLIAVLLLSWADTAASTFGRAFGYLTPKIGNKSLAGSLAAFITGVISCWLLYEVFIPRYNYYNRPGDISWSSDTSSLGLLPLMLITGVVGAVSEAIDIFDDNLTIPVISSVLMWGIIKLSAVKAYDSGVFA